MSDAQEQEITAPGGVALVVPKQHVKTVKTALEHAGKLDKSAKIVPHNASPTTSGTQHMRIATTIADSAHGKPLSADSSPADIKSTILSALNLTHLSDDISITLSPPPTQPYHKNPLLSALLSALAFLPPHILPTLNLTPAALTTSFPSTYSIYPPLLLLPPTTLSSHTWQTFITSYPIHHPLTQTLLSALARATRTTHIAINAPIRPFTGLNSAPNILRSPTGLQFIYGSFSCTSDDFAAALWVHTIQNNIHQTWSPLHTMFSRGNMREKTRILNLSGITGGETVVDMFAGIGYFAFSYKAAGAGRVVCFEMNGWSVEGLRRGCVRNGWSVRVFGKEGVEGLLDGDGVEVQGNDEFLVFQTNNTHALAILTRLQKSTSASPLPPIRHVNLGLLPDARAAWRDACMLIDAQEGGWVRVHENVATSDISDRAGEVEGAFQGYLDEGQARVEHVERVKMYAPGVVHCVFDVRIYRAGTAIPGTVEGRAG